MSRPRGVCSFPGCGRPHKLHGLCGGHSSQQRRGKPLVAIKPHVLTGIKRDLCTVEGCTRRHWARGYCATHYSQFHRGNTPGEIGPVHAWGERTQYTCAVPNCSRTHRRNGFCCQHSYIYRIYGIHPQRFEELLEEQGGVCAICRGECAMNPRLSVDHDHDSGLIRGLLCNRCNIGLGRFREQPELLRRAAEYIEAARAKALSETA